MTKKDFFILVIKLLGLFFLIQTCFIFIPQNAMFFLGFESFWDQALYSIGLFIVIVGIFLAVIYNAEYIVKLLKLESGFDDDRIHFDKLSQKTLVGMSSMILGGYLAVTEFPDFIRISMNVLRIENTYVPNPGIEDFAWLASIIRLFLGLFLVTNYQLIQKLLVKESE